MGMGNENGIHPPNPFSQGLESKFRRGINNNSNLIRLDEDRGTSAMILRIGQEFGRVINSDYRNTDRSTSA